MSVKIEMEINYHKSYLSGVDFISGVNDIPFETEFGVLEGVVVEGNIPTSFSIFTGVLLVKSKFRLIGAVVSVGCKLI